jgi:demethylmenaquinone methyltransferase/2-methoxy-6-polyprenyl-1,4-benzoquinol methylase
MHNAPETTRPEKNRGNLKRYNITAWFYDILDYPWELQYRKWRPQLLSGVYGEVLEVGVGTGRNLRHYPPSVQHLTALDFSPAMLQHARRRAQGALCPILFVQDDVCTMSSIPSGSFDWVVACFLCCVLPADYQDQALSQISRVLKPGGRFCLLEMVYSKDRSLRRRQDLFAPFVETVYGARFDRNTLEHAKNTPGLVVTGTRFIKHDTYLLIEGVSAK